MRPSPPPRSMPHQSSSAPPPNNSGADQLSRTLMPSVPLRMIDDLDAPEDRERDGGLAGNRSPSPATRQSNSASSASAPIQV